MCNLLAVVTMLLKACMARSIESSESGSKDEKAASVEAVNAGQSAFL